MKGFLRVIFAGGIIALAILGTAISCGDKGGGNNNNNGGGGNNGGGSTPITKIEFDDVQDNVVTIDGTNIKLKASGFPRVVANTTIDSGYDGLVSAPANSLTKAFDIIITYGGEKPKGGLVLVSPGTIKPDTLVTYYDGDPLSIDSYKKLMTAYIEKRNGIRNTPPVNATTAGSSLFYDTGWNIYGVFMNGGLPSGNPNNPDYFLNHPPIGFTQVQDEKVGNETVSVKPFLICRTTISTITSATDGAVTENTKLLGGQKATCFVGATGSPFTNAAAYAWLSKEEGDKFKKKFNITALGIKTDEKTIADIGLDGKNDANDTQPATAAEDFRDGLNTKDFASILKNNSNAQEKYLVSIEKDDDFKYTKPRLIFTKINNDVVEIDGNKIKLKASGFPQTAVHENIGWTGIVRLNPAPATSIKKVFDIEIIGGDAGDVAATAGLVLVDTGDKGANDFSIDEISKDTGTYANDYRGLLNYQPTTTKTDNGLFPVGWSVFSAFMERTAPTATTTDADVAPFAFTELENSGATSKPVFFCRTTVTTITDGGAMGAGTAQDSTVLEGGQKASCYIASFGIPFTGLIAHKWLEKAPANEFKKTFNIAAMGIRTDEKGIGQIGLTGTDKALAFRDGITTTEMTALTAANPSAYGKYSVEIIRGDLTYDLSRSGIVITNIDSTVAEVNGANIKLKASGFPTVVVDRDATGGYQDLMFGASTNSFKRAFDIVITDGTTTPATDGLVLVGPGNLNANTFYLESPDTIGMGYGFIDYREGIRNMRPVTARDADVFTPAGWNIFGVFMNGSAPTAGTAGPDSRPFGFTVLKNIGTEKASVKPFIICRTTISTITSLEVPDSAKLTGGHKASCFVGATGSAFTGDVAAAWLEKDAGDTFKKTFSIAALGIKTDGKTIAQLGLDKKKDADNTALANAGDDFEDGLNAADLTALKTANTSDYKKFLISLE